MNKDNDEIDWEQIEDQLKKVEDKIGKDNIFGYMEGFDFAIIMQSLLISKHGYIMDTGNWENANYVCAYRLIEKIKKHPLIWKIFFMIA